nr:MAG TPA: hypothetical protein [Caudoviricetes sp.]
MVEWKNINIFATCLRNKHIEHSVTKPSTSRLSHKL